MSDYIYKILEPMVGKAFADEVWYNYLTGHWHTPFPEELERPRRFSIFQRNLYARLSSENHCYHCGIPKTGLWGNALRFMGSSPSTFSPKLCIGCEGMARYYESGAEVELTMIFADVRASTPLAEELAPADFKEIINRFYKETTRALIEHHAIDHCMMFDQRPVRTALCW